MSYPKAISGGVGTYANACFQGDQLALHRLLRRPVASRIYSLDLKYNNELNANSRIEIGGGYAYSQNLDRVYSPAASIRPAWSNIWPALNFDSSYPTKTPYAYAQGDFHVGKFLLSPGIRYTQRVLRLSDRRAAGPASAIHADLRVQLSSRAARRLHRLDHEHARRSRLGERVSLHPAGTAQRPDGQLLLRPYSLASCSARSSRRARIA